MVENRHNSLPYMVTIITVVRNDVRVARSLNSVLSQHLPDSVDLEIIVVDDSDDGVTSQIIDAYGKGPVRAIGPTPGGAQGIYAARNHGLDHARGDVIAFLNADDWYIDRMVIADALKAFQDHETEMVYGAVHKVHESAEMLSGIAPNSPMPRNWHRAGRASSHWRPRHSRLNWLLHRWPIDDPGVFWRRSVFDRFGKYMVDFPIIGDLELFLRVFYPRNSADAIKPVSLDRFTTCFAIGGRSNVVGLRQKIAHFLEIISVWRVAAPELLWMVPAAHVLAQLLRRYLRRMMGIRGPYHTTPLARVYVIGFDRCGTTSFHEFFNKVGIPSIHWGDGRLALDMADNLELGRPVFQGYERYQAFTNMDAITCNRDIRIGKSFREIAADDPTALFILNVRPIDNWLNSMKVLGPIFDGPDVVVNGQHTVHVRFTHMERYAHAFGLVSEEDVLRHLRCQWHAHLAAVRRDAPKDRFLEFNIEQDDPALLCDFLGLPQRLAKHWGQHNRSHALSVKRVQFLRKVKQFVCSRSR